MTRVLLVDDQALVRSGFRTILETEPGITVVGEAEDGAEGVELARKLTPDVICMDIEMPVLNGIEATRQIVETEDPRPAILILTTFGHDEYLFDALAAGASGFLLKTARAEQLIDAINTLASGGALLGPDVTRAVIDRVRRRGAEASSGSPASDERRGAGQVTSLGLTEREQEVLALVALGRSNAEIAAELFLGEATVKTHVSNMLQKLGVRDRIQAVVWAHTTGFV